MLEAQPARGSNLEEVGLTQSTQHTLALPVYWIRGDSIDYGFWISAAEALKGASKEHSWFVLSDPNFVPISNPQVAVTGPAFAEQHGCQTEDWLKHILLAAPWGPLAVGTSLDEVFALLSTPNRRENTKQRLAGDNKSAKRTVSQLTSTATKPHMEKKCSSPTKSLSMQLAQLRQMLRLPPLPVLPPVPAHSQAQRTLCRYKLYGKPVVLTSVKTKCTNRVFRDKRPQRQITLQQRWRMLDEALTEDEAQERAIEMLQQGLEKAGLPYVPDDWQVKCYRRAVIYTARPMPLKDPNSVKWCCLFKGRDGNRFHDYRGALELAISMDNAAASKGQESVPTLDSASEGSEAESMQSADSASQSFMDDTLVLPDTISQSPKQESLQAADSASLSFAHDTLVLSDNASQSPKRESLQAADSTSQIFAHDSASLSFTHDTLVLTDNVNESPKQESLQAADSASLSFTHDTQVLTENVNESPKQESLQAADSASLNFTHDALVPSGNISKKHKHESLQAVDSASLSRGTNAPAVLLCSTNICHISAHDVLKKCSLA